MKKEGVSCPMPTSGQVDATLLFSLTLGKHLARRDLSRHQRHAPTGWAGSPQVGRFAATGEALSPLGEWSVGAEP